MFKEKYKDKIYIDKTKIGPKFDFSIFEILEKEEDLIIYKYSNKKYISNHDSLYQYFYDDFSFDDYKNAWVILFIGKIRDYQTKPINAVKGVDLNDNFRFYMIHKEKKSQYSDQAYGLNLYYVKDYENKHLIIIDSKGFGDRRWRNRIWWNIYWNFWISFFFYNSIINIALITRKYNTNRFDNSV